MDHRETNFCAIAWRLWALCLLPLFAHAVPLTLHFSGVIAVDDVAFTGTGTFRFSLLDDAGETVWSNDGTGASGSEPTAGVALAVDNGFYVVDLGDTTLANMTAIPAATFDADALHLRIWFDDGVNGSQLLEEDLPLVSVAFSIRAGSAERADVADDLADGVIEDRHLSADLRERLDFLAAIADGLVASSSEVDDADLVGAGLSLFDTQDAPLWEAGSSTGVPEGRYGHVGEWTGSQWVIWGGTTTGGALLGAGGIYDPSEDLWGVPSEVDAPEARTDAASVWTGSEMIVWGGRTDAERTDTGGAYDPESNRWSRMTTTDAPEGRNRHTAVWSGSRMITWGGRSDEGAVAKGGLYDPAADSWASFDLIDVPTEEPMEASLAMALADGGSGGASNWSDGVVDEAAPFLEGAWSVRGDGSMVYVFSGGDDSVSIFDVSDPATPTLAYSLLYNANATSGPDEVEEGVAFVDQLNSPWSGDVRDGILAVAAHASDAISLFDVSDPTGPSRLAKILDSDKAGGDLEHLDRPRSVTILDDGLLVVGNDASTDSVSAIHFFDISTPEAPQFLARLVSGDSLPTVTGGTAFIDFDGVVDFAIHDEVLFLVGRSTSALHVIDVSDVATPALYETVEDGVGGFERLEAPRAPTLSSDQTTLFVFSNTENAMTALDVSDVPNGVNLLSEVVNGVDGVSGIAAPVAASVEGYVVAVSSFGSDSVSFFDVRDPSAPTLVAQALHNDGTHSALEDPSALLLQGEVAYVPSSQSDALTVIDYRRAPEARTETTSAWAEDRLLVWGGEHAGDFLDDGFTVLFDEAGETPTEWLPMSATDAPSARSGHSATWTGTEWILWGGENRGTPLGDGARYDPNTDTWTAMATSGAPDARSQHNAVWTGSELLIVGGEDASGERADGFAYNPVTDSWRALSQEGEILARTQGEATWTGEALLMFGGRSDGDPIGALRSLDPTGAVYLFRKP